MAQTKTITGVVVDATGEPVIGASVLEVGTTNGTITDVDGNFTIQVPVGAKLDVSYIGYKTQQIVVGVPNIYKVVLKEDAEMLDEVVVTGYGMSQKRSLMTNSISKLDDKVLQNAAMSNAAQSLQGTVSGLRVTNTSGKPGSSPNIVLRGGASINKNLEGPLVVVDGLVRSMDDINPSDIESIQVLKDAASTAIYGARAGHGVVLITTKRGKSQKPRVTYSGMGSVQVARSNYKMLDTRMYMDMYNKQMHEEWLKLNGMGIYEGYVEKQDTPPTQYKPTFNNDEILTASGTDWLDAVMRNGYTQQHNLSVNGGTEKTRYLASCQLYEPGRNCQE